VLVLLTDIVTILQVNSDQSEAAPPSYSAQPFPAVYVGCSPIDEQQLVSGQCVKTVHQCIFKMTSAISTQPHSKVKKG